jgi:phage terminase large subunit
VPHDAKVKEWGTGRTRVETMRSYGLNPQLVPMASKMDGIQAARTTLAKACFIPLRCETEGIAALEQYRREWDDEKKTFRANEVHDWTSHLADAFRYLALAWRNVPEIIVEPKRVMQPGQVMLPGPPEPSSGVRIRI